MVMSWTTSTIGSTFDNNILIAIINIDNEYRFDSKQRPLSYRRIPDDNNILIATLLINNKI